MTCSVVFMVFDLIHTVGSWGGGMRNSLYTYLLFPEHRCSLQYTYSFGSDG